MADPLLSDEGSAAESERRVNELVLERQELRAAGAHPVVLESNRRDLSSWVRCWSGWLGHENS